MLPGSWILTTFLKNLGNAGCLLALLVFMQWVKVDGERFLNFYAMAKHIDWNIYLSNGFCYSICVNLYRRWNRGKRNDYPSITAILIRSIP